MEGINLDEAEWQRAEAESFSVPDKPEYSQNKYSAAFRVGNTGAKLYQLGKARAEADTSKVQDLEFTRENLQKYLQEQGYSPDVVADAMTTPANSWRAAIGRADYKKSQIEAEQQIGEMGVGGLALTAPFTIFDVDSLMGGPIYKGVKWLGKGKGLSSQLARKAEKPLAGAGVGAFAVATENTLLNEDDVSVLEGALFGGALGLGIAGLTSKLESQASLNKFRDGQGRLIDKQAVKAEELAENAKKQETLDELIEELEDVTKDKKDVTEILQEAELRDRKYERIDKRQNKTRLQEAADYATKIFTDAQEAVGKVAKEIEGLTARTIKNAEEVAGLKEVVKGLKAATAEIATLKKGIGTKTGQITELKRRLDELKGVDERKAIDKRKTLREKINRLQDEVAPTQARIKTLEGRIAKADPDIESRIATLEEERALLDKSVTARSKQLAKDIKRRDTAEKAATKAVDEANNYSTQVSVADARYSKETLSLRDRLSAFNAELSPAGLKTLIAQKQNLAKEVTDLLDKDDLDIKDLKTVRAERQNYINKLKAELDEVDKAVSLKDSKTFKRLPEFLQKLVISPIEKNLNSQNEFVRGLAQRLHAGTMYHGKVNTRNAWNLRTLLDTKRNRMEHAVIYAYREAVKDGYTGKFHEFEAEVADNARYVAGRIQRQLYTEQEGGINAKERLEVAKSRVASVTREHNSSNKHVQDATDAFLNYFEHMHEYGNKLNMEAFRGSLGKGYVKRIYSPEKIKALGEQEAVNRIVEAQRSFAIATNTEFVEADAIAKAETVVKNALDPQARVDMVLRDLTPTRSATESALKQRSIEAFDDELIDVLESDIRTTSYIYGTQVNGRMALKEALGVDNDEQIAALIRQVNPTEEEAKNFVVMIDTIKGTRELSKDPMNPFTRATKAASSYSSVMHTLGFVVPTMTEISSIAKEFGWSKAISGFVGNPREIIDIYRNGTPSDKNSIQMFLSYGDAYINNRVTRYDADGNNLDSVGRMQSFLDGTTQRMAVFGGLLPVTDMLRMTTASLSVDFLARMSVAKNISKTDMMRVEDMGFDAGDFEAIRKTLGVKGDGTITNFDRKTWGDLDEKINLGVNTMVERVILHPNGITLPKFMTDFNEGQFFPRIMFKFMRFPFESYERMLGRGMQEADAKQAVALAGNIAMWSLILAGKDALKDEDKQRYAGEEGLSALALDSFMYNSVTAGPVAFIDTGLGLLTGKTSLGYRYQIGGALASDYNSALKGDFRMSTPLAPINIGDGFATAAQTIGLMEESNKE
jgi:hypothetical protein